ncbi:MAG: 16S rRNA (guanine(966)-N(2))-methyltransferase RsmD [Cyanobacteriota bacterium]|nr:16S rRNA (guanine(966)-N(2))-methyltransferase RsmD [Cyanobacteriota bacterium]
MSLRIHGQRSLQTLPGLKTRPTSARVRQAVFNILQGEIGDCRWLDVCCGSGSMGGEALCRGASYVVGIESSESACRVIQSNWNQLVRPQQSFRVIRGDARLILRQSCPGDPFDVIYLDPPYESGLYGDILPLLPAWLASTGWVIAECRAGTALPEQVGSLCLGDVRRYGETALVIYHPEHA